MLVLAMAAGACTTHAFAQKTPDGKVYLNGQSGFLFFTSSFIKRCTESGTTLTCEKLNVVDVVPDAAPSDDQPKPKPKKKKPRPSEDSEDSSSDDQPKKKPKKPDSDDE